MPRGGPERQASHAGPPPTPCYGSSASPADASTSADGLSLSPVTVGGGRRATVATPAAASRPHIALTLL
ncbi:hypothetical protein E2C01_044340 [Portunus trituberculatus]|uniref:Uncharacterized protein n=1 Tax=Portunus trituberculatus TaxID=210409 RepID=A0A5B7FSV7_PORTR|nr:hypothetical protein [Portunus trituberculatus]